MTTNLATRLIRAELYCRRQSAEHTCNMLCEECEHLVPGTTLKLAVNTLLKKGGLSLGTKIMLRKQHRFPKTPTLEKALKEVMG